LQTPSPPLTRFAELCDKNLPHLTDTYGPLQQVYSSDSTYLVLTSLLNIYNITCSVTSYTISSRIWKILVLNDNSAYYQGFLALGLLSIKGSFIWQKNINSEKSDMSLKKKGILCRLNFQIFFLLINRKSPSNVSV